MRDGKSTLKKMASEDAQEFLAKFPNATEAMKAHNERKRLGLLIHCPYAMEVMARLAPSSKKPYRKNGEPAASLVDRYIKYDQYFFIQLLNQEDREYDQRRRAGNAS